MELNLHDWLNLLFRWSHLITGIAWIGSSFYFMWLDAHITSPKPARESVEGELWMVHSGGFYQVEKRLIGPGMLPPTLHWFKWEAAFTWITGFFLLGIVYYSTGGAFLVDPAVSSLSPGMASGLGVGILVLAWVVYDLLLISPIGKSKAASSLISFVLLGGVSFFLCKTLSARAAFIHVGALLGTIMVANVWMRILPFQRKMIEATQAGKKPDYTQGLKAKSRSIHNSYMTLPVLFMMLSNHYPMLYSGSWNWVVLLLLVIFGASVRHIFIARNSGKPWVWTLVPTSASLISLVLLTASSGNPSPAPLTSSAQAPITERVTFAAAHAVIQSRCVVCHSTEPRDRTFGPSPGGVAFDVADRIQAMAPRIKFRAVVSKTMPLANKTGITDEERELLGRWIDQGATLSP